MDVMASALPQRDAERRVPSADRDLDMVRRVTRWLDDRALDPILGFVAPGVGDLVGSAFGLLVIAVAVRRRVPAIVIARMLLNLGVDALIGVVPVLGDLADIAFRAHRRNADLLLARHETRRATWRDWAAVVGAAGVLVGALVLVVWGAIAVLRALF